MERIVKMKALFKLLWPFLLTIVFITLGVYFDIWKWHQFQNIMHSNIGFWKWQFLFNSSHK